MGVSGAAYGGVVRTRPPLAARRKMAWACDMSGGVQSQYVGVGHRTTCTVLYKYVRFRFESYALRTRSYDSYCRVRVYIRYVRDSGVWPLIYVAHE